MGQLKNFPPALVMYSIAGITYIISSLLGLEFMVFVSKPVIASSMFFHYWNESKAKVNPWHLLFLFLAFCSGILNFFEDNQTLLYVLLVNIAAYSLLLSLILKQILNINFKEIDNINLVYILLTILFMATLVYVCLVVVFNTQNELYYYYVIYALILTSLAIGATILYTLKHSNAIVYLLLATFCYLVCDLFYIIYYYYYELFFFRLLSLICNVVSFYFIVNYFLKSNESVNVSQI